MKKRVAETVLTNIQLIAVAWEEVIAIK